jgi:hypothetical protein
MPMAPLIAPKPIPRIAIVSPCSVGREVMPSIAPAGSCGVFHGKRENSRLWLAVPGRRAAGSLSARAQQALAVNAAHIEARAYYAIGIMAPAGELAPS